MQKTLKAIDKKRLDELYERSSKEVEFEDTWFIHTVLAQCFLPYRDPQENLWERSNGKFGISIMGGRIFNPITKEFESAGLPYGAKPRLFQSYICTQAIRQKSPVIAVEKSMTSMMKELGLKVTGGKNGSINAFKRQITRFAACHFTLIGPGKNNGTIQHIKAPPIKSMDIWFPNVPEQKTLWPSEITLTDDYFYSLKEHAIPYDFRALKSIQNNARAQDVYLWLTQRLPRISHNKPLFMTWKMLGEMFDGSMKNLRMFPAKFRKTMKTVALVYPEAKISEEKEGFRFYQSSSPIPPKRLPTYKPQQKLLSSSTIKKRSHEKTEIVAHQTSIDTTESKLPVLDPETYEKARAAAPGYDVYYLEKQWRESWHRRGKKEIKYPDKAFISYCSTCYKNKPII